jgi:hypothetical protein
MYHTKDGLALKAVINRQSGVRYDEDHLTARMGAYVENNREQFAFIFAGDTIEPAATPAAPPANVQEEEQTAFNVTDLKKLNKSALLDICESLQITTQDSDTREDLINLIDEKQKAEAAAKAAQAQAPAAVQ